MTAASWAEEPQDRQRPGRGPVQSSPRASAGAGFAAALMWISGLRDLGTVNFCALSHQSVASTRRPQETQRQLTHGGIQCVAWGVCPELGLFVWKMKKARLLGLWGAGHIEGVPRTRRR